MKGKLRNTITASAILALSISTTGCALAVDNQQQTEDAPILTPPNLELPKGGKSHGIIVEHTGYTLSYDTINHNPFWVAWQLTSEEANGSCERSNEFMQDPDIPARHAVRDNSYRGSGYDRGHMCPAGDLKWNKKAMEESFYMSNMCPQNHELNSVWWEHVERAERQWAKNEGSIYIVCGPIYDKDKEPQYISRGRFRIGIPYGFFKVVLSLNPGQEKAIGFIYLNDDTRQPMQEVATTIDNVEEVTGYDFFSGLDDETEERLESRADVELWNVWQN